MLSINSSLQYGCYSLNFKETKKLTDLNLEMQKKNMEIINSLIIRPNNFFQLGNKALYFSKRETGSGST